MVTQLAGRIVFRESREGGLSSLLIPAKESVSEGSHLPYLDRTQKSGSTKTCERADNPNQEEAQRSHECTEHIDQRGLK